MKKLILSLLWVISFQVLAANVTPESTFQAGTKLLVQGKYKQASALFEKLEKEGVNEPGLYNNMGIAYLKMEEKGRAAAYFDKALLLAPLDSQILYNKRYIAVNEISTETTFSEFIKNNYLTLLRAGDISLQAAVILFFFSSLIFLFIAFKRDKKALQDRWALINKKIILSAAVLFLISYAFIFSLQERTDAFMLTDTAGKIGSSSDSKVVSELVEGEKLQIKNKFNGWYKVKKLNGREAWVNGVDILIMNE